MRACPACRRPWPDGREVCPRCLATLVDDLDATITCPQCGATAEARRHTCASCFALLRAEDRDLEPLLSRAASRGNPVPRPPDRGAFVSGHAGTVLRLAPRSPLVLAGPDGLVEASVTGTAGAGVDAVPPLRCVADGTELFRLEAYQAAEDALVALGQDGAALATFLCRGGARARTLDIRDEASAPVARVEPDLDLVETGGRALGVMERVMVERDGWLDDEWSVQLSVAERVVPLLPLALVALPIAAKALLGLPTPVQVTTPPEA